jgi:hypothetical protein
VFIETPVSKTSSEDLENSTPSSAASSLSLT